MIITPLWHTEFLVDIANAQWENVRILIDSWLSDYAVGDMMERTVKVRLDHEKISTIDAIYISHSHSDHFDPYTLYNLLEKGGVWSEAKDGGLVLENPETPIPLSQSDIPLSQGGNTPLLILPFTLRYLESLITEYLPSTRVRWLDNRYTFALKWIEITGYMWPNPEISNEDDVMMIAISSDRELVFAEIDTIPDPYEEEVQKSLYKVFTRKNYETACYITSRNCLEWLIPYYDLAENKRETYRAKYIADQKEDMLASYEKYDYEEYAHFPNLFTLPGFVRGFVGQGIAYPRSLSEELYTLSIFPLDEIASIENDYAKNAGYEFSQKALLAWRQYKVENGNIEQGRKECPIGELIVNGKPWMENRTSTVIASEISSSHSDEGRIYVSETSESFVPQDDRIRKQDRIYATWPLFPRDISSSETEEWKEKILEILNYRFLPYWSASPVASLRDALIRNNGVYRIQLRITNYELSIIFEYSTARIGFIEVPCEDGMKIDEDYWILDILDFLEGRQEMYSSFWHTLDPKKVYRLWTCLGATYMNHDLNIAKYRLHFERAIWGETSKEFVKWILKEI
jgi:Beta-lactamase superfamily domain